MLTIKESMIIRKCLNDYVLENNLEYDKSPLFSDLIHKLKGFEHNYMTQNVLSKVRKKLNKELKRYDFQSIVNKKILELDKLESINNINKRK